ncbi:TetR/AcrR family transcriptional regulator [Antrihabitans cavernicola]|uniref:TetR family transcriptional regulator n=1 Tax=Antrihabitans cavernicola TaxID=2495913 RepID=A0A5A7SFW2_9NOCA|nr:TetR family transcriptional regulator [Spelaeibacter cavernicola]KAA0024082.1 TetR family transcriptional regulator [Spelaeibacter cavernicola]
MTQFKRARSAEQREARRQTILDTAASMLAEMAVSDSSLNELARRVGLAKSNVLRYFESREAVLLELLDEAWQEWTLALGHDLAAASGSVDQRCDQVAKIIVDSLEARPVLCDLLGAQASVLERNVSPAIAAKYKRSAMANASALAASIDRAIPELGESSFTFVAAALMSTGAIWTHTQPSAAMIAAYEQEPDLAVMRMEFGESLRDLLRVILAGLLARPV